MADQALPILDTYAQDRASERASFLAYLKKRRAACLRRCEASQYIEDRRLARQDALHYGRLIANLL